MLNELHAAELHAALDRVLRRYVRADLLVIDDFAVLAMDAAQGKLATRSSASDTTIAVSTAITTNPLFKDWTQVFPDPLNAQIIAERLTERGRTLRLGEKLPRCLALSPPTRAAGDPEPGDSPGLA